ncbi:MAG: hypothetical protein E6Q62_09120 [Nitrosomonas sp.]|nr:MAG: hypothetical protein E6Q62_09120 [Nitrosomonas sp.]
MTHPSPDNQKRINTDKPANRFFSWLLALALVVVSISGYWLFNSTSGLQLAFSAINRLSSGMVQFEGIQGTLRNMRISAIYFAGKEFQAVLHDTRIAWNPIRLLEKHIEIQHIVVDKLNICLLPSSAETQPSTLPENLTIPVAISIDAVKVTTMRIIPLEKGQNDNNALTISNFALSLNSNGDFHRLTGLDFSTQWGDMHASAALDGNAPFVLSAHIELTETPLWGDSQAVVTGNLERMNIQIDNKHPTIKREAKLQLQPFTANPVTQFHAELEQLNPAVFLPEAPRADLSVSAHLNQNNTGQLEGQLLLKNHAAETVNDGGIPFSEFSTRMLITPESLQLPAISMRIATDEIIAGRLSWHWQQQILSAGFFVNKLNPQQIDNRIIPAQVSGKINLQGNTQQQSASIKLNDKSVNLNAAIIRTNDYIAMEQLSLQRNQSRLTGQGKLHSGNEQSFELLGNLVNFNIADFIQAPRSNLNVAFSVGGKLSPKFSGKLNYTIGKSQMASAPVTGAGEIAFDGLQHFQGKAALAIGSNHLLMHGVTKEHNSDVLLNINAPALQQIGLGLAGDLHTRVTFSGNPKSPNFSVKANSQELHLPGKKFISGLAINGHLHKQAISLQASVTGYATDEKSILQHVAASISGKLSGHTIEIKTQIEDNIAVQLKATGAVDDKTLLQSPRWRGQILELTSTGKIPAYLKQPTFLSINPGSILLDHTEFSLSGGFLNIDQLQWTPKEWKTRGHFSAIAIYPGKQQTIQRPPLLLGGDWDFTSAKQLKGNLSIHREQGDWQLPGESGQPIGLQTLQLTVAADNHAITGKLDVVSQQLGGAQAHLAVPIKQSANKWSIATESPLQGEISAQISNLKWINALAGSSMAFNGQLQIHTHIKGTLNRPVFSGTASGKDLSVLSLEHGIDLQQGNLVASFQHSNLNIDQLDFVAPHKPPPDYRLFKGSKLDTSPGSLKITGNIGLVGNDSYLKFTINRLPVVHPTDYWIIASGSGQAKLHDNSLNLDGELSTDSGLLMQPPQDRPELAADITFASDTSDISQQKMALILNINVNLGDKFFIRVSGLEGRLAGQIKIHSDKKNVLKANGSITAQDTTFKAYGQDLTVKRGIVSFQGPLDDPALSVLAIREGLQVEAGVEILGTVRNPQIKLVSTPNVSDTEKLSWIVLGRKPDASGLDATALLSAAGSILGGQSGSGIIDQISRTLGVDEITVKQAGIGSSLTGQIGVVGKRLSSRMYLSYERSLTTTTMGITKLTYSLTPKITIVTQAGEDNAADLFYTIQFD